MQNKSLFRVISIFAVLAVLAAFPFSATRTIPGEIIIGRGRPIPSP